MINDKKDLVTNTNMPYRNLNVKEYCNKLKYGNLDNKTK